jgi:hypothetical protein
MTAPRHPHTALLRAIFNEILSKAPTPRAADGGGVESAVAADERAGARLLKALRMAAVHSGRSSVVQLSDRELLFYAFYGKGSVALRELARDERTLPAVDLARWIDALNVEQFIGVAQRSIFAE